MKQICIFFLLCAKNKLDPLIKHHFLSPDGVQWNTAERSIQVSSLIKGNFACIAKENKLRLKSSAKEHDSASDRIDIVHCVTGNHRTRIYFYSWKIPFSLSVLYLFHICTLNLQLHTKGSFLQNVNKLHRSKNRSSFSLTFYGLGNLWIANISHRVVKSSWELLPTVQLRVGLFNSLKLIINSLLVPENHLVVIPFPRFTTANFPFHHRVFIIILKYSNIFFIKKGYENLIKSGNVIQAELVYDPERPNLERTFAK